MEWMNGRFGQVTDGSWQSLGHSYWQAISLAYLVLLVWQLQVSDDTFTCESTTSLIKWQAVDAQQIVQLLRWVDGPTFKRHKFFCRLLAQWPPLLLLLFYGSRHTCNCVVSLGMDIQVTEETHQGLRKRLSTWVIHQKGWTMATLTHVTLSLLRWLVPSNGRFLFEFSCHCCDYLTWAGSLSKQSYFTCQKRAWMWLQLR